MTWRYSTNGQEMCRPSADGIIIDGPLSSEDLKRVMEDLLEVIIEQAKKEAIDAGSQGR